MGLHKAPSMGLYETSPIPVRETLKCACLDVCVYRSPCGFAKPTVQRLCDAPLYLWEKRLKEALQSPSIWGLCENPYIWVSWSTPCNCKEKIPKCVCVYLYVCTKYLGALQNPYVWVLHETPHICWKQRMNCAYVGMKPQGVLKSLLSIGALWSPYAERALQRPSVWELWKGPLWGLVKHPPNL